MPVFDYKCPSCERKIIDEYVSHYKNKVKCKQCGANMSKLVPIRVNADVFPAEGVYLEHVSATGKTFYSKKEMRTFEKENKMELHYLE